MKDNSALGVIIGHRDIFSGELATNGRREILETLGNRGIETIVLSEGVTRYGAVGNLADAKKCAELFRENRDRIDGIFVSLPNFGDERAIGDTLKMADLNVPVIVQAYPDEIGKLGVHERRDSFCGKLSVCNNLRQAGIPFSVGEQHTVSPTSDEFAQDMDWFVGICRVVRGLRHARVGCIGARVAPFKTVRYSEKILERSGISVETIDLSDMLTAMDCLSEDCADVQAKLDALSAYLESSSIPSRSMMNIAKLGLVIDRWIVENDLDACAVQCWPAMQDALGIFPCGVMSMLSSSLIPSACEVDVVGAVSMYALQLASEKASALMDWNNNYGSDPDKMIFFHCSNMPRSMIQNPSTSYNAIAAKFTDKENAYATCVGSIKPGPFTFARVSTNDTDGRIDVCIGVGEFTGDAIESFGAVGVAKIGNLQQLLRWLCRNGFEHHIAINHSLVAKTLEESMTNYLGWNVYRHC